MPLEAGGLVVGDRELETALDQAVSGLGALPARPVREVVGDPSGLVERVAAELLVHRQAVAVGDRIVERCCHGGTPGHHRRPTSGAPPPAVAILGR